MNMRIWRLAGVSLLALSVSAQVLADDNNQQQQQRNEQRQHGFDMQRQQQQNQQRSFNEDRQQNQQREQQQQRQQQQQQYQQQRQQEQLQQQRQIQQNQQQRFDQQRQQQERERNQQRMNQAQQDQRQQQLEQQQRQQQQQLQQRQLQDRQNNLPIQSRPDTAVQTQPPRQGFYRDNPNDHNNPWRGGDNRPGNGNWQGGRPPGGHGDGWGSGPRYRPGYQIDHMPGGYSRVPYRGNDYFYSSGYWYRPQGPRYVVVAPPRGVRVRYLPDYAQQVWLGSALFFVAAGTYYTYEQSTQEYIVAEPPQGVEPVYTPESLPQPAQQPDSPYDVIAYPANGQTQQQVEQDRYDCYRYAVQQSNFDPAAATYQPAPEVLGIYRQAMASCYASRGYSVQQ